jgi:hypothetical protein
LALQELKNEEERREDKNGKDKAFKEKFGTMNMLDITTGKNSK